MSTGTIQSGRTESFRENHSVNVGIAAVRTVLATMTVPAKARARIKSFGNYLGTVAAWGTAYWEIGWANGVPIAFYGGTPRIRWTRSDSRLKGSRPRRSNSPVEPDPGLRLEPHGRDPGHGRVPRTRSDLPGIGEMMPQVGVLSLAMLQVHDHYDYETGGPINTVVRADSATARISNGAARVTPAGVGTWALMKRLPDREAAAGAMTVNYTLTRAGGAGTIHGQARIYRAGAFDRCRYGQLHSRRPHGLLGCGRGRRPRGPGYRRDSGATFRPVPRRSARPRSWSSAGTPR